ncbi:GDSL-type esterase/lipase family protein [uncultured Nocardioides sp.]|uniref:GDSL-type esterase/lipase family protein n=1 Tax=uncultured Nocardioides sp. TaxID=198441 RepID=UPI002637B09F|nr:GDSL-type esterase/lipase family protein [uncultured Nocardioides sp.]
MTTLTDVGLTDDLLHGAVEVERTDRGLLPWRLPRWAREQVGDPQLSLSASQPSGVRLVLRTAATSLELDTIPTKREYVGAPPRPDGTYDVLVDGEPAGAGSVTGGDVVRIDMTTGTHETVAGAAGTLRLDGLPARDKTVEVWLPHDETTVLVALRADAPVAAVPMSGRTWVHHGSSISQGSNAAMPTGTWPAVAARTAGVDLVNLGFGGGALLDPATARTLRDLAAGLGPDDPVSVALGINVVNADLMRRRAFAPAVHGFLDTIREGNADVLLVVVTPILCPLHEDTPGLLGPDLEAMATGRVAWRATGDPAEVARGALTLRVVREELARVVAQRQVSDPHLRLVDGLTLHGEADAERHPLPDGVHPGPETHAEIGERFARHLS